ncbi:hypothetical protein FNF27_03930 [Cafeteria roenbergensis]|uniref:U-box domain-containing protein n=1 Tax=Cafeteria roenbergensis TaxID=33653 RepID=A0A5A8E9X9_CAFRO|nr:hypothetical protein FNF27_03930 [Cafeteria roenbergensis]
MLPPAEVQLLRRLVQHVPSLARVLARRLPLPAPTMAAIVKGQAEDPPSLYASLQGDRVTTWRGALAPVRIEGAFPLGVALSPPAMHPALLEQQLGNMERLTVRALNATMASVRDTTRAAVAEASQLIMAVARSGPEGRRAVVTWLCQAAAACAPLAREHHSPVGLPSASFAMHLSLAAMAAAGPVLSPAGARLDRVDPAFALVAAPALPDPASATPLLRGPAADEGADAGPPLAPTAVAALALADQADAASGAAAPPCPLCDWSEVRAAARRAETASPPAPPASSARYGPDRFGFASGVFWSSAAAARVGAAPLARKLGQINRTIGFLRSRRDPASQLRVAQLAREAVGIEAVFGDAAADGSGARLASWAASTLVWIVRTAAGLPMGAAAEKAAVAERSAWRAERPAAAGGDDASLPADAASMHSVLGLRSAQLRPPTVPEATLARVAAGERGELSGPGLRAAASTVAALLVPEWLAQDAADVAVTLAEQGTDSFDGMPDAEASAVALLEALTVLVGSTSALNSPHVPARLSEVVLRLFVPAASHPDARFRGRRDGQPLPESPACLSAISHSAFAVQHLPRALMSLYGAVERTGYGEKLQHRFRIMGVLRFIWTLPAYRESLLKTARAVEAGASAGDAAAAEAEAIAVPPGAPAGEADARVLEEFANGIVNQTTSLMTEALDAIEAARDADARLNSGHGLAAAPPGAVVPGAVAAPQSGEDAGVAAAAAGENPEAAAAAGAAAVAAAAAAASAGAAAADGVAARASVAADGVADAERAPGATPEGEEDAEASAIAAATRIAAARRVASGPLSEEEAREQQQRLDQNASQARDSLLLADQSLAMLQQLAVAAPGALLHGTVATRLASMLFSVLFALAGTRAARLAVGSELKARLEFNPRMLLAQVVRTMAALAPHQAFVDAALDSDMGDAEQLRRVRGLLTRKRILGSDAEALAAFEAFCSVLEERTGKAKDDEAVLGEIPECLADPWFYTILKDPVRLPTSGHVLERTNALQCLLNKQEDPFNRQPLTEADLQPLPGLGELAAKWVRARLAGDDSSAKAAVEEAQAFRASHECVD